MSEEERAPLLVAGSPAAPPAPSAPPSILARTVARFAPYIHLAVCTLDISMLLGLVLAVTTQNWLVKEYGAAQYVEWGLWMICCDPFGSNTCSSYYDRPKILSICELQVPYGASLAMYAAQAFAILTFILIALSSVFNVVSYFRAGKLKTLALIFHAVAFICIFITVVSFGTVSTSDYTAGGMPKGNGSVSWSYGIFILFLFLCPIAGALGVLERVYAPDYWAADRDGGWDDIAPWSRYHPLVSRMPLYFMLFLSLSSDIAEPARFSYNDFVYILCLISLMDPDNLNLGRMALLVLIVSMIHDITVLSVYASVRSHHVCYRI